jgi:hypothetical protein
LLIDHGLFWKALLELKHDEIAKSQVEAFTNHLRRCIFEIRRDSKCGY